MAGTLETRDLSKHFGAITAVDRVTLEMDETQIYGMIGPNGAGKTTLFNLVTGVFTPDEGSVTFNGTDITGKRPSQINKYGMVRTFQQANVFKEMTVIENLLVAYPYDIEDGRERANELLELLNISGHRDKSAEDLSGGQKKLVALARAFMTDPEFILLDEILAGVNPTLQESILEHVTKLHEDEDVTFLMIEHDINVIMRMSDHVFALNKGELIAEGPPAEIQQDEDVLESYLGGHVEDAEQVTEETPRPNGRNG